jgi:hypothetical protein
MMVRVFLRGERLCRSLAHYYPQKHSGVPLSRRRRLWSGHQRQCRVRTPRHVHRHPLGLRQRQALVQRPRQRRDLRRLRIRISPHPQ